MTRGSLRLAAIVCLSLGLPLAGFAQSTSGSITGTVSDQTGALVPTAKVQVINEDTGSVRSTVTTSAGVFNVPSLDVGAYRVRVTATGFTTYERGNLRLIANQIIDLTIQLQVGAVSTITQVEAAAPLINTDTSDVSGTMSQQS